MALAGNIVWWLTLGPLTSLFWFLAGCLMCLTVLGFPFGRAAFTMAKLNLAPFGKDVISTSELRKAKAVVADNTALEQGKIGLQAID